MTSPFDGYEWIDLSHTLEEDIPAYPTHARFGKALCESYEYGDVARHYALTMSEHTGTHMGAPLHFISEGPAHNGTDEIPLDCLAGRAATIQATDLGAGGLLGVALVGCNTLAIDATVSTENPAHYTLLGSEVYIVENLKNLDRLRHSASFFALPLKIKGGSPARGAALVALDRSATASGVR